jgi:hypothetical protein
MNMLGKAVLGERKGLGMGRVWGWGKFRERSGKRKRFEGVGGFFERKAWVLLFILLFCNSALRLCMLLLLPWV